MVTAIRGGGEGRGCRALVYDAKGDDVSTLAGMGLSCPVEILNPFDTRSVAGDSSKAVLRLNTPETAQWASGLFGYREVLESLFGESQGRNFQNVGLRTGRTSGESLSHAISKRELILNSEFLDLPETTPATGLSGFFLTPATGGFRDTLPGRWLADHLATPQNEVPNVEPRPEADQYLRPWGEEDSATLGRERPTARLHCVNGAAEGSLTVGDRGKRGAVSEP